jgi:uncharacterized alpha-E superfamily protein
MADDRQVQNRIEELVAEEHKLLEAHGADALEPQEHEWLEAVQGELGRLWDLLRQRRARREAGLDPEGASERDGTTVKGYLG